MILAKKYKTVTKVVKVMPKLLNILNIFGYA